MRIDPPVVIDTMDVATMALDDLSGMMKSTGIIWHSSDERESLHGPSEGYLTIKKVLDFFTWENEMMRMANRFPAITQSSSKQEMWKCPILNTLAN